jgi:uncharacterized protein (TIGR03437 family)
VIRQPIHSDRVLRSYLFSLAFLFILAPAACQAQAPPAYTITTVAGNCQIQPCQGNYAGDEGPALNAFLFGPSDVIVDSSGNIYISDTVNNRIRVVCAAGQTIPACSGLATGNINTVAGDGADGYLGDGGLATAAELSSPTEIAFSTNANLYIADPGNWVIREVKSSGNITTVAGDNSLGAGFSGDFGSALNAQFAYPTGVAVDTAGNIYVADSTGNVVRVVCANQTPVACHGLAAGDINTFAGNFDKGASYTGDNGPASNALLNDPVAVLLDPAGNLYIADTGNNAIRMVNPSGIITTVAGDGTGNAGYVGDKGPATKAELSGPKGIALDSSNNLYIADTGNSVIRMVSAGNGYIYTIAGDGTSGYAGDGGAAVNAKLSFPSGVAASGGMVYIADTSNNLVRMLTPPAQVPSIGAGGVVNDANYTAPVAPGSIAAVFGTFYLAAGSSDTELPLLSSLQNLSFEVNGGSEVPLYYVSSGQANIQVPWELAGQSTATLTPTLNGTAGAAQKVSLAAFAPAIFTLNSQGTGAGAILDSSYNLVDASNPAIAGTTTILIYCTGLGQVSANQPATGAPASLTALAPTSTPATVTIGEVTEAASFAGLAPGFVGLYQVNALVPAGTAAGNSVPVSISIGGATSNTVTIVVQ